MVGLGLGLRASESFIADCRQGIPAGCRLRIHDLNSIHELTLTVFCLR